MNYKESLKVIGGLLDAFDRDEHGDYFYEHGWEVCEAAILAYGALENQPFWISVEERLPEDDLPPDTDRVAIKVLTVTNHGTRRFVRELTRQRWYWKGVMQPWSWSKDARGVTHWMPLPSPPEVEV